jgi:SAM-dependent methyltransferase
VETECTWSKVAQRYADFLENIAGNGAATHTEPTHSGARTGAEPAKIAEPVHVDPEYILSWAPDAAAKRYMETHLTRFEKTLAITPPGGPDDRILEMGSYLQITPALETRLGYGEVRGCYYGPAGKVDQRAVQSSDGREFHCTLELFDAEKDRFPYADGYFSTVLCGELVEHLTEDPMHMMAEINRILRPGGHLVLTTPNIGSLRAISAIMAGYHPGFFPAYIRPRVEGEEPEARHNREYTAREIVHLFRSAGFETTLLETGPFRNEPKPEHEWVQHLLARYEMPEDLRGDGIYAVGRKIGPVRERYPAWLYQ